MPDHRASLILRRIGRALFTAGACVSVGYRCYVETPACGIDGAAFRGLVTAAMGILAGIATLWAVFGLVPRRLAERPARIRTRWIGLSWVGGLLLVVAIPVDPLTYPLSPVLELRVTATREKNPEAKASEVWVKQLLTHRGQTIPYSAFEMGEDWEIRHQTPVSFQAEPATLSWHGQVQGDLTLVLASHPYSGIVEITWDGVTHRVDLYNQWSATYTETLAAPPVPTTAVWTWAIAAALADASALGTLLLIVTVWLATRRRGAVLPPRRWSWIAYAVPCAAVWLFGLFVFWPGLMTGDSIHQWLQIKGPKHLSDGHPAFHTLTNWAITRVWESPAALALVQIIAGSAVCGWGLARLRAAGLPRWLAVFTCALLALSPVNAKLMITLWKDIEFSVAYLALMIMFFQVIVTDGAWLQRRLRWVALGVTATLVALLRHNGAPSALIVLGLTLIVYRRYWRRALLAGTAAAVMFFGVRGPLYRAFHVKGVEGVPRFVQHAIQPFDEAWVQLLAAHVAAGTPMTLEEETLLERICSLATWEDIYSPCCMTWAGFMPRLHHKAMADNRAPLDDLLDRLMERDISVLLRHYYWRTNYVWRVRFPKYRSYSTAYAIPQADGSVLTMIENKAGLSPQPFWPGFDHTYARFLWWLTDDWRYVLNWRPALHFWIFLAAVLVAAGASRNWKYLLLFAPILAHSFFIAWLAPCHCFRYQYPVYLAAFLVGPYLLWSTSTTSTVVSGRRAGTSMQPDD